MLKENAQENHSHTHRHSTNTQRTNLHRWWVKENKMDDLVVGMFPHSHQYTGPVMFCIYEFLFCFLAIHSSSPNSSLGLNITFSWYGMAIFLYKIPTTYTLSNGIEVIWSRMKNKKVYRIFLFLIAAVLFALRIFKRIHNTNNKYRVTKKKFN